MIRKGVPILNLFFLSPALQPGLTPYVRNESDSRNFIGRLRVFMRFVAEVGIEPIALGSTPNCL
jgi:hypothetical protein